MEKFKGKYALGVLCFCSFFLAVTYGTALFLPLLGIMLFAFFVALLMAGQLYRLIVGMTAKRRQLIYYSGLLGIVAFIGFRIL